MRWKQKPLVAAAWCALALLASAPASASDTILLAGTQLKDGSIIDSTAQLGDIAVVDFFYIDPTSNIQGFTLTVCFDCTLVGVEGSFTIEDTFLEVIGAEFISQQVDNDPSDGDGCELIVGILLDALPPFEGQTMPPTLNPLQIGSFLFFVPESAPCFSCFPVLFCDNINGAGNVFLSNRLVIDSESVPPFGVVSTNVCVPAQPLFVRGDANNDALIDIADLIFILNYLFLDGSAPRCFDAADSNDDGLLNISDSLYIALYVFLEGLPPPSPFPACGLEPIPDPDPLSCVGPVASCPFCP